MNIPGLNIRLLRKQMGLSLDDLESATGLDKGNLSKLERGEVGYSQASLEKIANVLRVSVGVLFAEPATVEAAALDFRPVPLLTPAQLRRWNGADSMKYEETQRFLRVDLDRVSRHSFALIHDSDADSPWLLKGDELIFDAGRQPLPNETVVAQAGDGSVYVGRFRPLSSSRPNLPAFEILPFNPHGRTVSTDTFPKLLVRGTMAKLERYSPKPV